jgi:hypothetical protein
LEKATEFSWRGQKTESGKRKAEIGNLSRYIRYRKIPKKSGKRKVETRNPIGIPMQPNYSPERPVKDKG